MTGCLQWLDSLVFGGEHSIVKMAAGDAALSGSGSDPVCAHARWCREKNQYGGLHQTAACAKITDLQA